MTTAPVVIADLHVNAAYRNVDFRNKHTITFGDGNCQFLIVLDTKSMKVVKSNLDLAEQCLVYETADDIVQRKHEMRSLDDFVFSFDNVQIDEGSAITIRDGCMFSSRQIRFHLNAGSYVKISRDVGCLEMVLSPGARTELNGMFDTVHISLGAGSDATCHSVVSKLHVCSNATNSVASISTMPGCKVEMTGYSNGVSVGPIEGLDDDNGRSVAAAEVHGTGDGDDGRRRRNLDNLASDIFFGFSQRALGGYAGPRDFTDTPPAQLVAERGFIGSFFGGEPRHGGGFGLQSAGGALPQGMIDDLANQAFQATQARIPPPRERHGRKVGDIELPADEDEEVFLHADEVDEAGKEPPTKKRKMEAAEPAKLKRVLPASEKFCIACESRSAKVAFAPCGHCDMCIQCAYEAMRNDHHSRCPTCMDAVTSAMRVYR